MSEDAVTIATLGLGVDSTAIGPAVAGLNQLTQSANTATDAANKLARAHTDLKEKEEESTAEADKFLVQLERKVMMLGKTRDEALRLEIALAGLSKEQRADALAAADAWQQYEQAAKAAADSSNKVSELMGGLGIRMLGAVGAVLMLAKAYKDAIAAFASAEEVQIRLEAMIMATGGAAERSAEQISAMATEMQKLTNFDDEAIKNAATSLMKFQSVSGTSFDRALKLSADLAALMRTDVTQAAEMVGRALENSYGASMLRRAGLLTDAQVALYKALKESGDAARAQEFLLSTLEGRYKGAAEELGERGLTGAWTKFKNQLGEAQEKFGESAAATAAMETALRKLAAALEKLNSWTPPDWTKWLATAAKLASGDIVGAAAMGAAGARPEASASRSGRITTRALTAEERDAIKEQAEWQEKVNKAVADSIALQERALPLKERLVAAERLATAAWAEQGAQGEKLRAAFGGSEAAFMKAFIDANVKVTATSKDAARAEQAFATQIDALQSKMAAASDGGLEEYYKALDDIRALQRQVASEGKPWTDALQRRAELYLEVAGTAGVARVAQKKYEDDLKAQAKALEQFNKQAETAYGAAAKRVAALEEETRKEEHRAATIGMTKEQVALLEAAWLDEAIAQQEAALAGAQWGSEEERDIALIKETIELLKRKKQASLDAAAAESSRASAAQAKKAAEEYQREWDRAADSISNSLTDALMRGFENGKSFAQNFKDTVVNLFKTMVLQPVIKAIVAPIAGGIANMLVPGAAQASSSLLGSGAGSMLGSMGGNFLGGTLGTIGSAFTGGSLLGAAGGFGAGATAALDSALITGFGGSFSGLAGGALTGVLGPAMAAAPYLLAAYAVYSMLKKPRGGPKTGGFGSLGDVSGITGTDSGRWFTPNSADADIAQMLSGVDTTYTTALSALGGTGTAAFALGFDKDPQGTAPNRLHAGTFVGGQQVYNANYSDLGRDDAALDAAMETETKRMILSALQASDLPQQIAEIVDAIDVSTATGKQVDNVVKLGAAMRSLMKTMDVTTLPDDIARLFRSIDTATVSDEQLQRVIEYTTAMATLTTVLSTDVVTDAQKIWDDAQRNSVTVLRDMGAEVVRLANSQDGSVESLQDLTQATIDYKSAVTKVLVDIKTMTAALKEMFAGTRTTLEMIGMSNDEQIAYLGNEIKRYQNIARTSDDPYEVNNAIQQVNQLFRQQLGLMNDDQLRANKNWMIQWWNDWETYSLGRMDALGIKTGNEAKAPLSAAQTALDGAADLFLSAAQKNDSAADKQVTASENNLAASQNNLTASTTAPPAHEIIVNIKGPYIAEVQGG